MIRDQFAGNVPENVDDLLRLPGVGRYTAGAIASIIFKQPQPIVDGNVQRVLARWDAMDRPPQDRAAVEWTWRRAGELVQVVPAADVATFNEALMELGATVCTPRSPRCDCCPVAGVCMARRTGRTDVIPPPKTAQARRVIHHHALLIERDGTLLLERRSRAGMWADLWQPPAIEIDRPLTTRQLRDRIPAALGLQPATLRRRTSFEHQTSHRRVVFHVYHSTLKAPTRNRSEPEGGGAARQWVRGDRIAALPLSAAHRRVVAHAAMLSRVHAACFDSRGSASEH
jgi:A/G-specific adenine glycosylase